MEWLNLRDYTGPQLAVYVAGVCLWLVASLLWVRNALKFGVVELPAFAACASLAWTLDWSVPLVTDLGALSAWLHKAWFVLDIALFGLVLRFGRKYTTVAFFKDHWIALCIASFAASAAFLAAFVREGLDEPSAIESLYLTLVATSFLFLPRMLGQGNLIGWSMWAALARSLGTALIGAFSFLRYPDHPFLLTMAVLATLADMAYLALFASRRRLPA